MFKKSVIALLFSTKLAASIFSDMDEHFKKMELHFKDMWNSFEQDMSTATKNSSLNISSSFDADKNAVIVKITIPGLTEKDIAFDMEDNKMVLHAKTDGRESLIVINDRSILVEQTEYEELTNKNGKQYTFVTGHNRIVNSLPKAVILSDAKAEYENGVLTLMIPSASKKMAIPVVYKASSTAQPTEVVDEKATAEKKQEPKKIIVKSKKKNKENVATSEDTK